MTDKHIHNYYLEKLTIYHNSGPSHNVVDIGDSARAAFGQIGLVRDTQVAPQQELVWPTSMTNPAVQGRYQNSPPRVPGMLTIFLVSAMLPGGVC
jgi:hypothetical protein